MKVSPTNRDLAYIRLRFQSGEEMFSHMNEFSRLTEIVFTYEACP